MLREKCWPRMTAAVALLTPTRPFNSPILVYRRAFLDRRIIGRRHSGTLEIQEFNGGKQYEYNSQGLPKAGKE